MHPQPTFIREGQWFTPRESSSNVRQVVAAEVVEDLLPLAAEQSMSAGFDTNITTSRE